MSELHIKSATKFTQQGVVLVVALVVLIAMTLAGLALWRSVDATNVIAGNLAFKQSSIMSSDRGIQSAVVWLENNRLTLTDNNLTQGYVANTLTTDPDWFSNTAWSNAVSLQADAAGNRVQYLIHRLCRTTGPYNGTDGSGQVNNCSSSQSKAPATNVNTGGNAGNEGLNYAMLPRIYYRITVRVLGPRNTISIVQSTVMIPV